MNSILKVLGPYLPPLITNHEYHENLAETPKNMDDTFPLPSWTFARKSKSGLTLPQTIAHRGFKSKFPENTMAAFKAAVEFGAHAVETDIHLTKDGEVVLSHDGTLSRCFGKSDKIVDLNWAEISALRTVQEPHEPMPRLRDLLEYLAEPGREDVWVLLDIKLDNDADTVMRLIGSTIASVKPSASKPWTQRIVLGIWAAKYLPYCSLHCAHFPLTYIGFLTSYASQFLTVPHVTFNLLQKILYWNPSFIRQAHAKNRAVYVWTVNDEKMMRWSIAKGVDGVITDDPEKFVKVREEWENGGRRSVGRFTAREWYDLLFIGFMAVLFRAIFTWKYPFRQGLRGVEGRKGQA